MTKRLISLALVIVLLLGIASVAQGNIIIAGSSGISSSDEMPSLWAQEQVSAAIKANLVPQSLQSKYTQATSRAEFCALAAALYEIAKGVVINERAKFSDTSDQNVEKMAALGVVNGVGEGKFAPADKLTREQAATMLSRLTEAIGKPLPSRAATFVDNSKVSAWALGAVGQMQNTGIMGGVGNNTFAPKDPYTREQSIATILRLFNLIKEPISLAELTANAIQATITMEDGSRIMLELYPDLAPQSVRNFVYLARQGFYDGLKFHRIIKDFMIQGGDPLGNGTGGPGYSIKGEFSQNGFTNELKHTRGVLSMARSQNFDSAGSQFFIMHADTASLDGSYAAFGKVTSGMDVVDKIADIPNSGPNGQVTEENMPVMKTITIDDDIILPEPDKI